MRLLRMLCIGALVVGLIVPAAVGQDQTGSDSGSASASEPASASAPPPSSASNEALTEAVDAYRNREFASAARIFAALAAVESDPDRRAILHANAGTAAARADEPGEAVWHLRAAERLAPRDPIIRANLQRVVAMIGAGGTEESQFTDALLFAPRRLSAGETQQLAGILAGLGLIFAALWRWDRVRAFGWLALVLMGLAGGWLVWARLAWDVAAREAVVIEHVVPLRSEPQGDGLILLRVGAGALVSSEEVRGEWRLVETAEGGRGWAPVGDIRPLP